MQKTINGTLIVILFLSALVTHIKADDFEGMMTLRVNDHEYKVKDNISAQSLESEEMFTQSQKVVLLK